MAERTEREVLREALGFGLLGICGVIFGLLISNSGNEIGNAVTGISALFVVLCLATAGYELIRRDKPDA